MFPLSATGDQIPLVLQAIALGTVLSAPLPREYVNSTAGVDMFELSSLIRLYNVSLVGDTVGDSEFGSDTHWESHCQKSI